MDNNYYPHAVCEHCGNLVRLNHIAGIDLFFCPDCREKVFSQHFYLTEEGYKERMENVEMPEFLKELFK